MATESKELRMMLGPRMHRKLSAYAKEDGMTLTAYVRSVLKAHTLQMDEILSKEDPQERAYGLPFGF